MDHLTENEKLAFKILQTAERFNTAYRVLNSAVIASRNMDLNNPMMVLLAFAFELYLKCLIILDTNKRPKRNHDLYDLFLDLTPATQQEIRDYYAQIPENSVRATMRSNFVIEEYTFDNLLKLSRNTFEGFRYLYEGVLKPGEGMVAGEILMALLHVLQKHRPDWPLQYAPPPADQLINHLPGPAPFIKFDPHPEFGMSKDKPDSSGGTDG